MSEEDFDQERLWKLHESIEHHILNATVINPDENEELLKELAGKIVIGEDGRVRVFPEKYPGESWTREEFDEVIRLFGQVVGQPQDN